MYNHLFQRQEVNAPFQRDNEEEVYIDTFLILKLCILIAPFLK